MARFRSARSINRRLDCPTFRAQALRYRKMSSTPGAGLHNRSSCLRWRSARFCSFSRCFSSFAISLAYIFRTSSIIRFCFTLGLVDHHWRGPLIPLNCFTAFCAYPAYLPFRPYQDWLEACRVQHSDPTHTLPRHRLVNQSSLDLQPSQISHDGRDKDDQ